MNLHSNSEREATSSHVMLHPVETAVEKLWHVPKLPIVSNSIFFHPYLDILQHNAASSFILVFHQLQIEW